MINSHIVCLLILVLPISCVGQESVHYKQVGDVEYDPKTDNPEFEVCDSTHVNQYYNFGKGVQYEGEKYAITQAFNKEFKNTNLSGQTGYVTIRFLVNCKGQTDRFRVQGMDTNYEEMEFKKEIIDQLLKITKSLNGWIAGTNKDKVYDYYQYLTFKIKDGNLIEILP